MATTTFHEYTGDGSDKTFDYTFPTYFVTEVKVQVDGVIVDNYTVPSYATTGTRTVTFDNSTGSVNSTVCESSGAPKTGLKVRVYRDTTIDAAKHTYSAGESVKAGDLNTNQEQVLRALQEEQFNTITTADIADNSISGAKIKNDAIDSQHYAANSIDTEHYAPLSVDTAALAGDAVNGDKIANTSIDSEHYVVGSIDTQHLANDAVNHEKLDDDAVRTDHIKDLQVTTPKLEDESVTSAKIKNATITFADIALDTIKGENMATGTVAKANLGPDSVDGTKIENNAVDSEHIAAGALDNEHYAAESITLDKLDPAAVVINSEQLAATANDTSVFTTSASDARYFNVSSGDTIKDGVSFPDNDTTIATTAAINDRIVDLVDEVGGFVPLTTEAKFPATNPDINNGVGTIVSIGALGATYTPNSGTCTIPDSVLDNISGSDVLITDCGTSTLTGGYGCLVETTTTLHTYKFHRLTPKTTEVTTVASKATEIGRLGTTDAIEDMGLLGTTDCVADMAILGTSDVVADLAILGTTDVVSDLNTLATSDIVSDLDTCATNVAKISTVSGKISDVETVSDNISAVENFSDLYQIHDFSSAPTTDGGGNAVAEGDLAFDSTANRLKVYSGSAWETGVEASSTLLPKAGGQMTGNITMSGSQTVDGRDLSSDGSKLDNIAQNANNYSHPNHSGDVTSSGDGATTIANDAVTYAKMQDVSATNRVLGRDSANSGIVEEITPAALRTMINVEDGATADQTTEEIQDIVGPFIASGGTKTGITVTYDDDDGNMDFVVATQTANDFTNTLKSKLDGIATSANNYVHPNHSGEVTSTADGVQVVADDVIDEANLKADNSPTNDYVLTAKSSAAGGLTWAAAATGGLSDIVSDTSPQLGGDLDTNDFEILLDDGHKVKFGESADLTIYHDNTSSTEVIKGNTTLDIGAQTVRIQGTALSAISAKFAVQGACELNYNTSKKFETTNTGVTITGDLDPAADSTHDLGSNGVRWANGYFDTLYGDGSNLTNVGGTITALNNATANELVTVGATTTELDAEASLTFQDSATTGLISGRQVTGRGFECPAEVSDDWTIAAANNAMFPGPMTVAANKTVTVPAGRTLTVV